MADPQRIERIKNGIRWRATRLRNNHAIRALAKQININAPAPQGRPVAFFNTSSRLGSMSLNAAYSLLTSWSLRLSGIPIVNFACQAGMTRCIHGTTKEDPSRLPPCKECIAQSKTNFKHSDTFFFQYEEDTTFESAIHDLSFEALESFTYNNLPLGRICRSSLRWVMRRYHLENTPETITLFKHYLRSGWNVAQNFTHFLDQYDPRSLVVFNGIVYPEAIARFIAQQHGIPVISHEVSLQPNSAFFTHHEATFRASQIPDDFIMTEEQNQRFNEYFSKRTRGQFKMAGVTFWKDIQGLNEDFLERAAQFKQIVPVFTNVIFDTSQEHANTIFPHMFAWLDFVYETAKENPETLFVFRAHPDEARPGKASEESVADWAKQKNLNQLANAIFIGPNEPLNSYELISRSKFTMIYTSTIGLESTLLNTPVLCAGKSYFNEYQPVVHFPADLSAYKEQLEDFLLTNEKLSPPLEHKTNAKKFLYYQLYYSSLPFGKFIEEDNAWRGYVKLKKFSWEALLPEHSDTMQIIQDGILNGKDFVLAHEALEYL